MCNVANESFFSPENPVHRFARKGVGEFGESSFAANVNSPLYVRLFAALRSCKELPFPIMGSLQDC
jgi:hypothetical protein